ncbi:efflux RND transporter periplasmic adaptor subunit [Nitrosomonas sp.]|uniref:efflux RND transporter periplasmic adaptor subunit n=1 Tax=Nitrosomonas sp. TaxID=42353 RepID=UPI001DCBB674|nr:efflux RND transporter periplasmic adaptor subunit [Nitrosomonas sp.]MCB1950297.1 efflux RND transporter periplasmic adaptor subunit [Nitrosomonas sp.]MCP5243038.1 efflux RND transporter periplasmic adaptor subunit [Burkholderiales bacterium]MDR4514946.1 efflux RND transporter periplasmic adaptor subunit [Nitrosomonas sp.]
MKFSTRLTICLLFILFLTVACSNGESTGNKNDKQTELSDAAEEENPNIITLSEAMAEGIKTETLKLTGLADKIQVPSHIKVNEQQLIRVGANVTGRIVEVNVELGDSVDAGMTLARISSPELTTAQLAYLRAHSMTVLNERAAKRAKLLLDADVIGAAELQRREAELQVSRAELSAAKDQLRLLGVYKNAVNDLVKRGQILPSVGISSPKSGTIIERNVVAGQVVQPSDQLFKVADLSTVWAVGDVPEHIAGNVTAGQNVEIQVPALGNIILDALIIYVSDTVNPQTRTVMVRTVVENQDRKLKPGMLASMRIIETPQEQLVIPESAIVRELNRDYVYLNKGNHTYSRIPVELGPEIGNLRPVISGLSVGQHIVIDGAFHIDSERKLDRKE